MLKHYLNEALFCVVAAFVIAILIPYAGTQVAVPLDIAYESRPYVEPEPMSDSNRALLCRMSEECEKLAEVGYFEARSESDLGIYAVMHSLLNRVVQQNFGTDLLSTVEVKDHYTYLWDGSTEAGYEEKGQRERTLILAYKVMNGESENPIADADHYHRYDMTTSWSQKMQVVATIGAHTFFR